LAGVSEEERSLEPSAHYWVSQNTHSFQFHLDDVSWLQSLCASRCTSENEISWQQSHILTHVTHDGRSHRAESVRGFSSEPLEIGALPIE